MKGIVDEGESVSVLYIDGKPSTKYTKKHEAEADMERIRNKFPNKKVELKQEVRETEAKKGADGKRCWKGKRYAGTENGKDKCIPVKKTNESAYEKDLQDNEPRTVQGVYGMKSKPFTKKFANQKAQDRFFDHPDREGNYEIHYVQKMNESSENIVMRRPGRTTIVNRTTEPTPMARAAMGALANHYQSELDDLNKKREARKQGKLEENMGDDTYEIGQQLMDIALEIKELADSAMRLVRGTPEEGRARSYWYPHIVMAVSDDHGYMGKNMATMSGSAEALMNGEDEEYMDEARAPHPLLKAANKNLVDLASGEVRRKEDAKKAAAKREREYAKQAARAAKPKKPTLDQIWQRVEHAISNYFPDGDPTDYLNPYMERNNLTWDDITRAAKKNGYKDLWDYWNTLAQDIENDAYADWHISGGKNVRQRAPFMETPDTSGPVGTQPGGWQRTDMDEAAKSAFRREVERQQYEKMEKIANSTLPHWAKEYLTLLSDPKGKVFKAGYRSFPKGQDARAEVEQHIMDKYKIPREWIEKINVLKGMHVVMDREEDRHFNWDIPSMHESRSSILKGIGRAR